MDIVGKVNLLAANATTDLAFAFMRVFGTLLVGFLATFGGVGLHFMLTTFAGIPTLGSNGLLFMLITFTGVAAVLLLRRMRDVEPQIRTDLASPVEDLSAGLRYVASNPIVWTLLILGSVVEVFGWNYRQALLGRAFDLRKIYWASWKFVGLAAGLGALVSLLFLSIRKDIKSQPRLMMVAYIFMAVSMMIFAWSPWLVLSAALMACVLHANELLRDYGHSAPKQSVKGDAGQGVGPSIRVGWFLECAGIANLVHHWLASQDILRRYWRLGFLDGHCSPGRANNCRRRVRNCGRRRIDHVEGRVRNIQVAARHRI